MADYLYGGLADDDNRSDIVSNLSIIKAASARHLADKSDAGSAAAGETSDAGDAGASTADEGDADGGRQMITLDGVGYASRERFYDFLLSHAVSFRFDEPTGAYVGLLFPQPAVSPSRAPPTPPQRRSTPGRKAKYNLSSVIPRNETYRRIADVVLLRYATYCRGVKNIEAMRVRRRSVQWVVKLVGDMYDQIAAYRAVKGNQPLSLAEFVVVHFNKKFGLRQLADQNAWDFVFHVEILRKDLLELEIFGLFLDEYYEDEDLGFFLDVRSRVIRALDLKVTQAKSLTGAMLSKHRCEVVARSFFKGADHVAFRRVLSAFLETKKENERDPAPSEVDVIDYLYLVLIQFNKTRTDGSRQGNSSYDDFRAAATATAQTTSAFVSGAGGSGRRSSGGSGVGSYGAYRPAAPPTGGDWTTAPPAANPVAAGNAGKVVSFSHDDVFHPGLIAAIRAQSVASANALMHVTEGLRDHVVERIRGEMTEEIHELVADAFAHVVDMLVGGGGGGGGLAGLTAEEADYRGELREQLAAVTRAQLAGSRVAEDEQVSFARNLLQAPDIRRSIRAKLSAKLGQARAESESDRMGSRDDVARSNGVDPDMEGGGARRRR